MSRLPPPRLPAAFTAAALVAALGATVALGADRVRSTTTPRGRPAPAGFKIAGAVARSLRPGSSQALPLRLTNPHRWDLQINHVTVALTVDAAHRRAGCDRDVHYRQVRIPRRFYPLRLRARSTRTLRQLGVTSLPRVVMRNLSNNQDACKGARLGLRFAGLSARAGRPYAP